MHVYVEHLFLEEKCFEVMHVVNMCHCVSNTCIPVHQQNERRDRGTDCRQTGQVNTRAREGRVEKDFLLWPNHVDLNTLNVLFFSTYDSLN